MSAIDAAGHPFYANAAATRPLGKGAQRSATPEKLAETYQAPRPEVGSRTRPNACRWCGRWQGRLGRWSGSAHVSTRRQPPMAPMTSATASNQWARPVESRTGAARTSSGTTPPTRLPTRRSRPSAVPGTLSTPQHVVRVMLVDDHDLIREGYRAQAAMPQSSGAQGRATGPVVGSAGARPHPHRRGLHEQGDRRRAVSRREDGQELRLRHPHPNSRSPVAARPPPTWAAATADADRP